MKTMIQKAVWLFLIAVAFTSCAKDDDCDPTDEESSCYVGPPGGAKGDMFLLTEQKINGKTVARYEYDGQNRMTRSYPYDADGVNNITISYTYNANGLLTVTNFTNQDGENFLREEYSYGGGDYPVSMVQTQPNLSDGTPIDWQFTYSNNRLASETAIPRDEDALVITMAYNYDSNGNLVSWEQKADGEWLSTLEYGDYDDRVFIAKYGNPYFWKASNSNANNPRTEKTTSQATSANKDVVITYTYNNAGYPTKADVYNRGSDVVVETREYNYKKAN